jgi:hypothetical protein
LDIAQIWALTVSETGKAGRKKPALLGGFRHETTEMALHARLASEADVGVSFAIR